MAFLIQHERVTALRADPACRTVESVPGWKEKTPWNKQMHTFPSSLQLVVNHGLPQAWFSAHPQCLWRLHSTDAESLSSTQSGLEMGNLKTPTWCCLRVSIAIKKHHDQKQVGEDRVYLAYPSSMVHHWRQSVQKVKLLSYRIYRSTASWLVPYGLLSLHSCRTQDLPPSHGTTYNELGPAASITN